MGSNFRPNNMGASSALRGAQINASRAVNAPQYVARGQGIAAQKYVDAAKKAADFKPKKAGGSGIYPKSFKEI